MATNIEQIFRSFVVNKFKEIQEENRNSENMDVSQNGEVTAPGTEDASEGSSVIAQNEGSSQTSTKTEDAESKPMEIVKSQILAAEEKEGEAKDLKTTDLSSDDEVKRDSSKKKSKKHKKHKSKKKKKKKKKEKNEKRSKSHSSVEDQENGSSETNSVWQPVGASPREQDTSNTLSSQMEENVGALPSLVGQEHNVDSVKEHPTRPQLDIDSGFFGPKCPNEMHFSVSSNLTIPDVQMPEPSKELAVDIQENDKNKKCTDQNNENSLTKCETAEALHNEIYLPLPGLVLSEGKDVELQEIRLESEERKDHLKQSDNVSSQLLQSQSKSSSTSISKLTAKSRSRSNSLARENRSRSKSLTKVPKKQANSKSLTRQRSRSSSVVRRRRSRSSSIGQRRRSKSKSPVRRRRSQSSTPARYSKSPIRSWWSKSIRNRQRSVSIERRRRSRTRSFERRRRSRTRSLLRRRRSRSRSSEKGHNSRTRSSAKRIKSRSRSATRRRKSRSTSRKHRLHSRSASRRKSKSAVRTPSKSSSPSRKRKSKSVSPPRRQKSKSSSPVRRGRSRSRSAVQKRRSRSGVASRKKRSRSGSGSRRRKSRSVSFTRRRRSRSSLASRRRKSRSGSPFRRRRSRSAIASRRRRSRSPSVSRRRRSKSPSVSRRRRSRSPSVSRRRKSRSASASRKRRSRSASRRRRSRTPSVSRRRRSRSGSRRRRSRSASKRRKSRSTSRRRRSRSAMISRRRRSRSASASRRHKSRSASRRRRSRSDSASRRRRSKSDSVSRRRRSRSDSTARQRASRFDSISKRQKSRSGSDTRRPRSNSQQKAQSYSASKRKSRSTSVSRGEQSTLSSASKVQSREYRRSRSKGENRKSRSRSSSVKLKSVESETTLQSKSSEQKLLETASIDEKQLSLSASIVEQHNKTVLPDPDKSSALVTESKSDSSLSRTSSPGEILIPCTDNVLEIELNVLGSSTTSMDNEMKSEQIVSSTIQFNEDTSTECDMEIEPISFTPIETACPEQSIEVVNIVETSKETFEFESTNDYSKQHTNLVDLRTDIEPEQKTACKPFDSSLDSCQIHGLSQLNDGSMVVPIEEPNSLSCYDKPEYVETKPELNKSSESSLKESEHSSDNIAASPNIKLSSIDPLPNSIELLRDSESIKSVEKANIDVSQICISSAVSDYSSTTVKQDIPVLLAENEVELLYSSSATEGKSHVSLPNSSNDLDLLYNKQENIIANSLNLNEGQHFPVVGSSVFPGSLKDTEEEVSANMLNDHQRDISNFKSPTLDEDKSNRSESNEEISKSETSPSEVDKQRLELNSVKNTLAAEQNFSSSPTKSFSHDIHICNETESRSASSCVTQSSLLDNSSYKELISNYDFKETGEPEVSHPIENKQTLSTMHSSEVFMSTCQVEESCILPVSSPYEVTLLNTSEALEGDKRTVYNLLKQDGESTNVEENSDSESALQDSPVPPIVDYHEIPRSKEPTTNVTNLTAHVSPSKLRSSTEISDSLSHKVPQCSSGELVKRDLSLLAKDKMEIQRHYEVLSNTSNTESYSEECKIRSKPSPFNSVNNCAKQEVDKLYADAAQMENSANSNTSSDPEAIYHFEKTSTSRDQHSLPVLPSEKESSSSSKSNDGNLQSMQLRIPENEFSQNTENTILNTETEKLCFGDIPQRDTIVSKHNKFVSISKDSDSDCLTNSTDGKIHVNDNSQEESVKSCRESGSNLYIQQELLSKNKERINVEKENSIQSLTDLKQTELEIKEQSTPNNAKPEPAYIGLRESKPQEEPKSSPKPFLHETGRLSVSSVPVQFKFSKTFKTLGVSQLCSTSEDSSDVEISKVNTSGVTRNTSTSASGTARSGLKALPELPSTQHTPSVSGELSKSEYPENVSAELSQSDHQSGQLSEKDLSQPDNQGADDLQSGSSTKHPFPHISNAVSKLGVKQRQYRSRSVAQDSRTPSADRGRASRSRSKSLSRRRRSKSKSSSRKKRSSSTTRKKSSHSKSDRRKRSRSRSRGRKGRSQSKSKGKKKRSTSKLSAKRKRSTSKSSERIGSSKSSGKQRSSRSTSKTRKKRLQSKSPEKKGRSRSKSESRKNLHSKTVSSRKRSRSKSPIRRRKSRSKSLSSRSRSRSVSASWKHFSHSKSSLHRKRSHSSSRSASPRRRSRSRNKRHSFSRSPAARSNSRSRSRWRRSRSRGRWRRSRSLSATRRRSRSTSRLSSSLSTKKRKSLSPVRRRRSRSQNKQKDKSPLSKRKSTSPPPPPPPPQKKSTQLKPAGFKHSIGLKSLIQKQLSQAKSQGSAGKLSKEQIPLPSLTSRTQLSIFSTRSQASVSNLSNIGQIPVPNLAEVPLPSVSAGSHIPMPPAEPLSVSSLAAETQLSVPDLTTANQWHVPDMSSGAPWSVPDIAAGTQWSMADLGAGAQWPMSDLTAGSHWPMHDLSVGAQWSMPDLAAGTQWAVPDVATGAQWAVPDLTAGTQWTVPDLTAGSQWAMTNMTAAAQWAVPDLAATAQWTVPDLTAGAQIQRADLVLEAQVPGSDLAPEAQVPGSDLATEAQVPGSDLAAEAQVPGSDLVAEAQVPPEHDLILEEHNVMPDVAAEALVPVASSTVVPDVAAGIPLPDVAAAAQMPVPDVAATIHMPDVATEAQKQMSDFATQAYMSLKPEESVETSHFAEPILSSEHQTESDSCDPFVPESSIEPSVNTSSNLKIEETLSSGQQVPLNCFENSQSIELSDKTISVDKHELQLNQDPETDMLLNAPKEEPAMDSESHLSSETCRSSDVPFSSCEGSDYSVHSMSVESDPSQEHSLFDGNKDSGTSLQCEPDAFVESQTSPIQAEFVEPSEDNDQPLHPVKDSMADNNFQVEPYNSDHTLMEEQCSDSVCSKWVPPYASPDNLLQNESPVNSNTTLDINAHSISGEIEACVPNHSQQVDLNPSLNFTHPTEHFASPEHPQLVEPYNSPVHPQLVEPYNSPVHPQLVEPYPSPQHPPLVELYSSPERPQLVEPYASPDFPQLVEPYASPDRQQLDEPYSDTQDTDISQPSTSPILTENACSPAEKPEECSISGHILTYAAVTCTQINSDSSCSDDSIKNDFSQLHEYPVMSDVPKTQDEIVGSDYPQLSNSNNTNVSLQEVPCPSLLKTYSLESNLSPKETNVEECSPTERQEVEPSMGSYLEDSVSPAELLTKLCSPHTVDQEEQFPIPEHKPLNSCSLPDEPKLASSCISTSEQLVHEERITDDLPKSEEVCSVKEVLQSHEDCVNSEQVQEQLHIIPVDPQEDFQSTSEPYTHEPCFNAADATLTEYEQLSAEEPRSHPDNNLCIPVLSNTIINLCGGDQSCTIIPSPDRPEQETVCVTELSHSEESKTGSEFHNKLLATQGDELLDKPPPSSDSDSHESRCSSPSVKLSDCPNSFLPEHSSNPDLSMSSEYSTKISQSLDQTNETDNSPTNSVYQSQEFSLDRCTETSVPTENASFPADLPSLNQDVLQYSTSDETSDLSVECMKHKLEDSVEDVKTDHFTITPPDLLPYDSDQPTDMCSEPSSEPVQFISQPPPELLPYDSEQPANSFLSISDYSTEQGSSDFHAPPELLPYDSDQPIVMHNQQTEPTAEVLPVYDSTVHHEAYKTFDLPTVDSVEYCDNSSSLNSSAVPEKCELSDETVDPELNSVKEVSSECSASDFASTEHTFTSEPLEEHSIPCAVDCIQDDQSSWTTVDEQFPAQQLAENEQPLVQEALGSEIPEHQITRVENQTEQSLPLTSISNTSEVQCATSYEMVTPAESETATILEIARSSPPRSLVNTEVPQIQSVSKITDSTSDLESGHEHSQSRSIDRKKSRSKSVTPTKKSNSKSLVRSRRSKSRSASAESNRCSPAVKRKESSYVVHKKPSRSPSVGRRRRSRSSSLSPRKRSRSSSVGRKCQRRHSRSPSEFRRQSRSPSVTSRRRSSSVTQRRLSRSSSAARKRRSPSTAVTRKKSSPSPVSRRRRSPSASRRRRSPSPPSRRRRTPSPPASRRRRSPSATRRRRSRSPSATRRRRSPSPPAARRRRSPSPSTTRRRRSPSPPASRRRRSPSPPASRRRRSPSPSTTRRRRSPSPSATRRRRSPSPSASRRRRSPSSEIRRKRSPSLSVSHKRHSHSPSLPRKRRSRSTSASRRRCSRSASQRKGSRSPSAPRKRRSKSKSPSKSPSGIQSKSERSQSLSQTEVLRKRKTRSRSSSRDKKTVEKRRKRSSSKDSSKDYYSVKQRRKSRTPPRRKKSRSPSRRASVCKSPVRRRRSRSPIRRKSFSRSPIRRKRSRSRDKSIDSARSPKRLTDLDKAQLLEIAKANAAAMCAKAGVPLPPSLKPAMTPTAPAEEKITHRTYGVTIQELTEKCKQIAQSKEDDVIVNKPHDSDDEEEDRPFYNHPFKVSEHKPISFSLLNPSLKPAPKTQVTLTKEFPVSSGSQHRKKESDKVYGEWVPVDKNTEENKDDVFTNTGPAQPVDITSAMTERAAAQTRLTGNPYDIEALFMLNRAQEQIDAWAQSSSIPGQFTGSTGAQVLSAEEISNSGPQAWLKKDQFLKAAPVSGGRGALLMRKMGWKEGEGLGRNNEGNVDPILLDFKTDRKGLVADGEKASNKLALPAMKDLSGKHPISALMELCNKKKWSPPDFELVDDTGPEHRKRFLFRVTVNGVLCQPSQPSVTKKLAKATAAAAALQALGALPKESITSTSNFCSASTSTL